MLTQDPIFNRLSVDCKLFFPGFANNNETRKHVSYWGLEGRQRVKGCVSMSLRMCELREDSHWQDTEGSQLSKH